MKKTLSFIACGLVLAAGTTFAGLDIVASNPQGEEPVYVLKNTSTGRVVGTFWDRAKGTSDFGFESSIVPDFVWSKDRDYVAVTGGASRSRATFLFKVVGNTLKEITVPQLNDQQSAPLNKITDSAADGVDPVRWQGDGTLLLHFWSASRVRSESETQKVADVWADLEVNGTEAKIVGTSTEEPSAPSAQSLPPNPAPPSGETLASTSPSRTAPAAKPAADDADGVNPRDLAGTHHVIGKNPDGTTYKGSVEIRVRNGLALMEWKVGETVSHGTGVVVGNTLGVALDSGLAIYQIVGQSDGISLLGCWASEGSTTVSGEAILIGNADMTQGNFPPAKINGDYRSLREAGDSQVEGTVTISGSDAGRKVLWTTGGRTAKCQGLALGAGLAIIAPDGLSVLVKHGDSLEGRSVTSDGKISQESLIPAN